MANTVYTESVVTLNGAQAEATLNSLKSSADDLRKKMIEATKLGNTEEAAKYQKQLDQVQKAMKGIKQETKDYSDLMKNLNGASLNTLAKAYSNLNKQIKNLTPGTDEFIKKSQQLKQVKARMDEIQQGIKGTNKTLDSLRGLLPKVGLASIFAAAGAAIVKFGKDAIAQTNLIGDRWNQFAHGMKSAYNSFVADLSSGKGWKELIQNMRDSYAVGKQVEAMLDEIFERQNSLTLTEADYNVEIEKNKQIMKDQTKTAEERLAASNEVLRLERELADEKRSIAEQEAEAYKMELQQRTKLTDAEMEAFIQEYNKNRDLIQQATEYQEEYDKLQQNVSRWHAALMTSDDALMDEITQDQYDLAVTAFNAFKEGADQTVAYWADVINRYNLGNDEMVSNYVQALAKQKNAEADYYRSTSRTASTNSSLRKQIRQEQAKAAEDAFKKEVDASDRHFKELQNQAKQAYVNGELSEQQYQNRLTSIQEQSLRAKIAIAERYKKETLEYESQLLDMAVKEEQELRKVLEQAQADVDKVMAELEKEAEKEIEAAMAELDKEMQEQIQHLLDLADQAEEVRAALDPQTALGQQLEAEIASLQEMYDNKMLSEEEFQKAKQQLIKDFAKENLNIEMEGWMKGIEAASSYCDKVGDMVSALQDAELASLDAQMQAELAAAGDNAERREQIEADYEQRKLDTQKKYAVADMVINIAKTIAAGALAVMQAFAQLGPIGGAISAALIGVTTAAEVAMIIAQKNAIMNTTVGSTGSTGSQTGARVATGYSSGGYTTQASNDYKEVGVVHANEWVAPASMVRSNPILFRRLEMARKTGSHVSGVGGFADGGMTSQGSAAPMEQSISQMDPAVLAQLTQVLQYIIDNGIPAYVLLSDINKAQDLQRQMKKITSKT